MQKNKIGHLIFDPSKENNSEFLSHQQMNEDIHVLIDVLENAYPAKWIMKDFEWNQIINTLRKIEIYDSDFVSVQDFGDQIADILCAIPDGHLIVRKNGKVCGMKVRQHKRIPQTGTNIARIDEDSVWKIKYHPTTSGELTILAITCFPQFSDPVWIELLKSIEKIKKALGLIIDLRGNTGGDDSVMIEFASRLWGSNFDLSWVREIVLESPHSYALQVNAYRRIIWDFYESKGVCPPQEIVKKQNEYKERMFELLEMEKPNLNNQVIIETKPEEKMMRSLPKFKLPIYVLIDANTASSGEWTSLYFKRFPQTQIIGENSYGMIHFGNSGLLRLPNSELTLSLCMKINQITTGEYYEKIGVSPDIKLFNKDSLEYVLGKY